MYKMLFVSLIVFSGCSKMNYNAPICDKIKPSPNVILPEECRNYSEVEATKAFNKTKEEKKKSDKEIIEFHKEDKK